MTKQLDFPEFSRIRHLIDGVQCERALVVTALSGGARAEVFVDNAQSPNVGLVAYNNEAIILGAPICVADAGRFITDIRRQRRHRRFASITCPTKEWRDLLLDVPGIQADVSERNAYTFSNATTLEPLRCGDAAALGFTLTAVDHDLANALIQSADRDFHDFRTAWASPDEFMESGLGYCVKKDGEIASIAFSYLPVSGLLEIGTATAGKFRRQGLAGIVASKLMEQCVVRGIEPLWSCYAYNSGSNALARKLGFQMTKRYYWLYERPSLLSGLLNRIRRSSLIPW